MIDLTFNQYLYPIKRWINNVVENKINDEILLLVFKKAVSKHLLNNLTKHFTDLKMSNYKILDIDDIVSVNDIELNCNVILLGHFNMDTNKIKNNSKTILFHLVMDTRLSFFTAKYLNLSNHQEIITINRYQTYIEQRDPIEIIKTFNYNIIREHVDSLFLMEEGNLNIHLFSNMEVLQSNKTTPLSLWRKSIDQDVVILCSHKILTSRLAVALYKATTLKFSDTNTKIGSYYRDKLKVKSVTVQLPRIKPIERVKAYKLNL